MMPSRSRCLLGLLCLTLLVSGDSGVDAQSGCTGCPSVQHMTSGSTTLWGVELGTKVSVSVVTVNNAQGSFTSAEQSTIGTAAGGITAAINANTSGSSVTATVTNTNTDPATGSGTAANPIMVVEMATQDQINTFSTVCGTGNPVCTVVTCDGQGHTIYSKTLMLASQPPSSLFEQGMTHEFSMSFLGLQECTTCTNTIANSVITSDSPTKPTCCDDTTIKNSQCAQ